MKNTKIDSIKEFQNVKPKDKKDRHEPQQRKSYKGGKKKSICNEARKTEKAGLDGALNASNAPNVPAE